MTAKRVPRKPDFRKKLWFAAIALVAFASHASAQAPSGQSAPAGKLEFDVVSIHPIKPEEFMPPNFDMTAGKNWWPNDLYKADFPVWIYIAFAYHLFPTAAEQESLLANQPKWLSEEGMAIRMRASGNPTKDQARLMMQSMLADRFKLALHFETHEAPVLALTLIHPGKLGPKMRPHTQGPSCDVSFPPPARGQSMGPDLTPPGCGLWQTIDKPNRAILDGARDVNMSSLTAYLSQEAVAATAIDRPIVDQTGLTGTYDFSIQFTPESGTSSAGTGTATDPQGTTFVEALQEQLGMKLVRTTAPVRVPVIDHIERPSEN